MLNENKQWCLTPTATSAACMPMVFSTLCTKRHTPYNYLSRYVKGRDQGSRLVLWVTYESVATLGVMYKDKITNIKSDTPGHVNRGETAEEHRAIEKMVKKLLFFQYLGNKTSDCDCTVFT